MKILHITDSHGTAKKPDSRTDLYYLTFLRKLAELSYVIKLHKIDMILHTGDLFHTSTVSNKFVGQVAEIIKSYDIPFYIIPGNHDINGYTIDTIDQTSLGVLIKTGVVKPLTRDYPLSINAKGSLGHTYSVAISGQEYYEGIDKGNMEDFEMQQTLADINVLGIHGYVCDKPQHPDIRHTLTKDIITDADIVLSGHWHRSLSQVIGDVEFYNPGSMLRVEHTPYNETFMPQYGILSIDVDTQGYVVSDYKFHKFRIAKPAAEIFDITGKAIAKHSSITLNNFKNSLANTMAASGAFAKINQDTIIKTILNDTFNDFISTGTSLLPGNDQVSVQNRIDVMMKTSQASSQTKDSLITKGYMQSLTRKRIEEVELHNFQSHKHTTVKFTDGLNILVGESNEGKTAIIRGIMWATNNDPSGSAFIMTGEKDCYVKITYSDGSYIKRHRTEKDSGGYEIQFRLDDGTWTNMTLKGFGSDVPIEVLNVHQMPKVSISKDLSTNLNVMMQLDAPFLISSSQTQKAEAIGKIANTDTIDASIRSLSLDVLADKKIKKQEEEKLKKYQEEQKLFANTSNVIRLQAILKSTSEDIAKIERQNQDAVKVSDTYKKVSADLQSSIQRIQEINSTLSIREQVVNAEKLIFEIKQQQKLIQEKNNLNFQLQKTIKDSTKNNEIVKNKSNVLAMEALLKETIAMKSLLDGYDKHFDLVGKHTTSALLLKDEIKKEKEKQEVYSSLMEMQKLLYQYNQDKDSLLIVNEAIMVAKDAISEAKSEINNTKEKMKTFVLDFGICPCCGQSISEECANKIVNQREEL